MQGSHRDATSDGGDLVDRRVEQRAARNHEEEKRARPNGQQSFDLTLRDTQKRAKKQCLEAFEDAVVEAQEEKAEGEAGHLNGADDRGFLRSVSTASRTRARRDHKRGEATAPEVSRRERKSREGSTARAREGHHRECVAREALTPENHEPAGNRGHHGHDRSRLESIHHERIDEQLAHVRDQIDREVGIHG